METPHQRLGPHAMVTNLVEMCAEDTKHYDLYEDKSQNNETLPILDEESEVSIRDQILTLTQLVDPIRIQSWIHAFMRWNFVGEKLQSWQLT